MNVNCANCGETLKEDAKFCPSCGTRVEEQQSVAFCVTCGTKLDPSAQFCPGCGVRVGETAEAPASTAGSKLLSTYKLVSLYHGEPTLGIAKASGTLMIYEDRIEFEKQLGNALGGAFGLVGLIKTQKDVKKDPVDIYHVSEITKLRTGKYAGVYSTLVVELRGGKVITFCPVTPGSSMPENVISVLTPYLK